MKGFDFLVLFLLLQLKYDSDVSNNRYRISVLYYTQENFRKKLYLSWRKSYIAACHLEFISALKPTCRWQLYLIVLLNKICINYNIDYVYGTFWYLILIVSWFDRQYYKIKRKSEPCKRWLINVDKQLLNLTLVNKITSCNVKTTRFFEGMFPRTKN